ncbi:MAG: hypothetical protein UU76_C0005G0009 [Parcubacteria group bacterium GW2011_GWC1_41_7]|nr:MAG: hypothetical protein UU76_C0005G0009 [Parcubacteria group bacterium GW2011_GWC1_41_7]
MSHRQKKPREHCCPDCQQRARFLGWAEFHDGPIVYHDRPLYVCDHGCKGPDGHKLQFVTYKSRQSGKRVKAIVRDAEVPK